MQCITVVQSALLLYVHCEGQKIVTSDSLGGLYVYEFIADQLQLQWSKANAHSLEVWCCSLLHFQESTESGGLSSLVASGADDGLLCLWDLRQGTAFNSQKQQFDCGVCSIEQHPCKDNILSVGSYDDHLHLLDRRMLRRQQYVSSVDLHGGVWRHKWQPVMSHSAMKSNDWLISAAVMYNGFHLLKCNEADVCETVAAYTNSPHSSLAYGLDWFWNEQTATLCGATCSFYDNMLSFWCIESSV